MEIFFMNAANMEQLVTELKDEIYNKLHHRTLLAYTGQPPIWDDQLFYLLLPRVNGEQWTKQHQVAAQSVAMIQTALTTHDLVKEQQATSKAQQLMVLAGDYYSGMYYDTLAKLPDIQFVQKLSNAVAEISEQKTAFYEPEECTLEELLLRYETIVSRAVEQFMGHFGFTVYIELMKKGMLLSRLSAELKKVINDTSTIRLFRVISERFSSKDKAIRVIQQEITTRATKLTEEIHTMEFLTNVAKTAVLSRIEALNHSAT